MLFLGPCFKIHGRFGAPTSVHYTTKTYMDGIHTWWSCRSRGHSSRKCVLKAFLTSWPSRPLSNTKWLSLLAFVVFAKLSCDCWISSLINIHYGVFRYCFSVQWVKVAGRGSVGGGGARISWKRAYGLWPPDPRASSRSFSHSSRRKRGMCINVDDLDLCPNRDCPYYYRQKCYVTTLLELQCSSALAEI